MPESIKVKGRRGASAELKSETPKTLSKSEYAAYRKRSTAAVSQWIAGKKIFGQALLGTGRNARIVVSVADRQLAATLDSGQAFGNGLTGSKPTKPKATKAPAQGAPDTKPPPADEPEEDVDISNLGIDVEIKMAKLAQLQRLNRKGAEDEAASQGRYTETTAVRRQMTMVVAQTMRVFEGAIPEIATAIAAAFKIEERAVLLELQQSFRKVRDSAAEASRKAAELLPALIEDSRPEPEAP